MSSEKREFLIQGEDGVEYGPAGLDELRQWVRENRAGPGSFVRLDEPDAVWEPWQHYPELTALAAGAQGAGPARGAEGLTMAPLTRRILAVILDMILCGLLSGPIVFVAFIVTIATVPNLSEQLAQFCLQPQNPVPEPLFSYLLTVRNLVFYPVLTLYMAGFQAAHGQTPAKALLRLRVVGPDGGKPPPARALLRGLLFSLSVYLFCLPLLCVLLSPQRRAFHDYAANTCVVEA